ncbi:MAG: hypothetical protein V9F04_16315 [Dermatophilaceae bacterium]
MAVGGAALIGDIRAARLAVASPTTRSRDRRLRSAGPIAVIVRRDWLGLHRNPSRLVAGLIAVVSGSFLLSLRAGGVGLPMVATIVGAIATQSGLRGWCEGLRLQGDNAGTPPLLGIPARHEALAHLLVPTALYAGCVAIAGGAAYLASGRCSGGHPVAAGADRDPAGRRAGRGIPRTGPHADLPARPRHPCAPGLARSHPA